MSRMQKLENWLNSEKRKDDAELEKEKLEFAKLLSSLKKTEILDDEPKKDSLWIKIKKALMGF